MNLSLNAIGSGIRDFFSWWVDELVGLLPERYRRRLRTGRDRLVLAWEGERLRVVRDGRDGLEAPSHYHPDDSAAVSSRLSAMTRGREVVLELAPGEALVTDLTLPAAAEENLRQVLGYEMDRHTPFTASQVHFGFRRMGRRTAGGRLPVRLGVVPRARLDEQLEALALFGLTPNRVQPPGEPDIDLMPATRRASEGRLPSLRTVLVSGVVLVVILALAFPIWNLRHSAKVLRSEAADFAQTADTAQRLRAERDQLLERARAVVDRRSGRPPVAAVLEELASLLPDHTWVMSFQLSGDSVVIRGETPSASDLIGLLQGSPRFRSVGFSAPVTREGNRERFQITMQAMVTEGGS